MLTYNDGVITKTQIDQFVATWAANNDHNCQNSFNSYQCLMASLSDEAQPVDDLE